jgi:hypothetical protein
MEAKKKILKEMIEGIKHCRNDAQKIFNFNIKEFSRCRTAEEVMRTKRDLLIHLTNEIFPLYGDTCYFCIDTNGNCKICKFAKFHKKCESNEKSDYKKIIRAIDKLGLAFENYYRGEIYPEDSISSKGKRKQEMFKKHPGEKLLCNKCNDLESCWGGCKNE